jgi:hypothetical protein
MLFCCESLSTELLLNFNCFKSNCVCIGPAARLNITEMKLCHKTIQWSKTFKYLGVNFTTGQKLTVDTNYIKRKFFAACNCILGNANTVDEIVKLSLMESYCLPILMFAIAAMRLSNDQINDLNAGRNSVDRRIFGFNKWESVRSFIWGLGRLDFKHLRLYQCLKFCKYSLDSNNLTYAHMMNMYCLTSTFKKLCVDSGVLYSEQFRSVPVGRLRASVSEQFCGSIADI